MTGFSATFNIYYYTGDIQPVKEEFVLILFRNASWHSAPRWFKLLRKTAHSRKRWAVFIILTCCFCFQQFYNSKHIKWELDEHWKLEEWWRRCCRKCVLENDMAQKTSLERNMKQKSKNQRIFFKIGMTLCYWRFTCCRISPSIQML